MVGRPAARRSRTIYQYQQLSGGGVSTYPVSGQWTFPDTTATVNVSNPYASDPNARDTSFSYLNNSLPVTRVTECLPDVSDDDGPLGGSSSIVTNYNSLGQMQSVVDADGYTMSYIYNPLTGVVTTTKTVVNLATGATVSTSSTPDLLGRPIQTADGDGNVTTIKYVDGLLQSTVTTTPQSNPVLGGQLGVGPQQQMVTNAGQGMVTTEIASTGNLSVPAGSMQTVSEVSLDFAGRTLRTKTYDGTGDTYTTENQYDDCGRLYVTEDAAGTIKQTDFDNLGRPCEVWVGTYDPNPGYQCISLLDYSGSNMALVEADSYDNGGVGDGDLTQTIQYTNAGTRNHVTNSYYDWRDRLLAQNNGLQVTFNTLDNLGETTETQVYDATQANTNIVMSGGSPQAAGRRRVSAAQTITKYDEQGRAYETDQSTASVRPAAWSAATWRPTTTSMAAATWWRPTHPAAW